MKKILAGIIAAGMTFSGVTSFAEETNKDTNVLEDTHYYSDCLVTKSALKTIFTPDYMKNMTSYMFGVESDSYFCSPFGFDLNNDSKTDIADMIIAKNYESFLSEYPNYSVSELNYAANIIFQCAQCTITEFDNYGLEVPSGTISSDENTPFVNEMNRLFSIYSSLNIKWEISTDLKVGVTGAVVCSPSDSDSSGTYPVTVPINYKIPFSEDLLSYSQGSVSDFEKFKLGDEEWIQNEGLDKTDTTELYNCEELIRSYKQNIYDSFAKEIYNASMDAITNYDNRALEYPDGITTSEDGSEFGKYIEELAIYPNLTWYTVCNHTYGVEKVVLAIDNETYSFPQNALDPEQSLSAEEAAALEQIKTASEKKLKDNAVDCPELILLLPAIRVIDPKKAMDTNAAAHAKILFNAIQETIAYYDSLEIDYPEGIITSEGDSDFVKSVKELLYDDTTLKSWNAFINKKDGVVKTEYTTKYTTAFYPQPSISPEEIAALFP